MSCEHCFYFACYFLRISLVIEFQGLVALLLCTFIAPPWGWGLWGGWGSQLHLSVLSWWQAVREKTEYPFYAVWEGKQSLPLLLRSSGSRISHSWDNLGAAGRYNVFARSLYNQGQGNHLFLAITCLFFFRAQGCKAGMGGGEKQGVHKLMITWTAGCYLCWVTLFNCFP